MSTSTLVPPNAKAVLATQPISRKFGFDRGTPIDRYYIEKFLAANARDIHDHVLEIGDSTYANRYGTSVIRTDVLHADAGNRRATIIGDLVSGREIPSAAFDCIILTQTLCCIFDLSSAVANVHRALAKGGVVLATVPGISQISRFDMDRWGDYWRFTTLSARRLFEQVFASSSVQIEAHGSLPASVAFLEGRAVEECQNIDLDQTDPDYEMLITIRAQKR
ncbi:MAG TPA: methyltransferase domain-containing protein [Phycisphaerae bacterium]|nr:methyltransferase domain-containing protein [Phycisphaerae bacterium]